MTIGLSQLSKLLGITERRINQLVEEGVLSKVARGTYNLGKCIQAYIAYKEKQIEELQLGGEAKRKAEEEKAQIQAEMLKLDLAERLGELSRSEDLIRLLEPIVARWRQLALGLPKKAARDLQNKEIEQYLITKVRELLDVISTIPDTLKRHRKAARREDPKAVPSSPTAAKPARKRVGRQKPDPHDRA